MSCRRTLVRAGGIVGLTSQLHLHFAGVPSNLRAVVPDRCHGRGRLVGGPADRHVLQVPHGRRGAWGTDLWTHPRRDLCHVRGDDAPGLAGVRMGSVDHTAGAGLFSAAFRNTGVRGVGATKGPAFDATDGSPSRCAPQPSGHRRPRLSQRRGIPRASLLTECTSRQQPIPWPRTSGAQRRAREAASDGAPPDCASSRSAS